MKFYPVSYMIMIDNNMYLCILVFCKQTYTLKAWNEDTVQATHYHTDTCVTAAHVLY